MTQREMELCPGCGSALPPSDSPTHRYIGASSACWAVFSALVNGNEPSLAPAPMNALILDAYAAQHPGVPSPQAIQSVAVHLLTLYGVLRAGVSPANALWVRQRALRVRGSSQQSQYRWLEPPSAVGSLTVLDIAQSPTPSSRAGVADRYVWEVWRRWEAVCGLIVAGWYKTCVL